MPISPHTLCCHSAPQHPAISPQHGARSAEQGETFGAPASGVKIRNSGVLRPLEVTWELAGKVGLSLRRQQTERGGSNADRPRCLLTHAPTPIFHSLVFFLPSLGGYGPAVFELCHSRRTGSASLRLLRRSRWSLLQGLVNQAHYAFAPSDFRPS